MSGHHQLLVKKGKDCVAVAKNALDDIGSGRKEMALKKLSALQRDGSLIADAAEQLAERLEAVEKYYQHKDAEVLREIGDLSRRENELKHKKSEEEIRLASHQKVLQDKQDRLSSESDGLRDAERKWRSIKKDEAETVQIGASIGGALFGSIGATAGAYVGDIINACKQDPGGKDAEDALNRCKAEWDSARSAFNESLRRISNLRLQIMNLGERIERMKSQCLQSQKKLDKIRPLIVLVKQSVNFWLLFKQISEHGVDRTALLQKIVTRAAEKGDDYHQAALQSKSSQNIADTFIKVWEEMECGGPNHILLIEYRCSQCSVQCTALPYVNGSEFICTECHSKYTLKN